ncbi:MAG TPA: polysaccharide lyase family 7 protein [Devosiaceae bacterium]|jgi:hypothetical protein
MSDRDADCAKFFTRRELLARYLPASGIALGLLLSSTAYSRADDDDDDDASKRALPGQTSAPKTSINLANWKITLPIDKKGRPTGRDDAVEVEKLIGFALPPYFSVTSNSITFQAPTNGSTTDGSGYPRSELREMNGRGGMAAWTVATGGRLSATLRINEVPRVSTGKPGRIVIGQIHGPNDELCRLYYDAGQIFFVDDKAGDKRKETSFPLLSSGGKPAGIPIGARFSYTINVNASTLVVTVKHGGTTYSATDPIGTFWPGKKLYFKAGAYVQVGAGSSKEHTGGTGQGSVTFFALNVQH